MNEFTKEELTELLVLSYNDKISYELHEKIQSMLDNYCEHEQLKDVGAEYMFCRMCGKEVFT